jgi:hypothetical protein
MEDNMRFFVHVIDDASLHQKSENGEYGLVPGEDLDGSPCHIQRSDAFYITEANDHVDAVTKIANNIRLKSSNGENVLLSESFTQTAKDLNVMDFGSVDNRSTIDDIRAKISTNAYNQSFMASCQIPMKKEEEYWIELHKVCFFVVEENKIIEI